MVKVPLFDVCDVPVEIDTEPPTSSPLSPALTTICPPTPSAPLPTTTLMLPPAPLVASPVLKATDPLLPTFEEPDSLSPNRSHHHFRLRHGV